MFGRETVLRKETELRCPPRQLLALPGWGTFMNDGLVVVHVVRPR